MCIFNMGVITFCGTTTRGGPRPDAPLYHLSYGCLRSVALALISACTVILAAYYKLHC
jgi:hypothetical protein